MAYTRKCQPTTQRKCIQWNTHDPLKAHGEAYGMLVGWRLGDRCGDEVAGNLGIRESGMVAKIHLGSRQDPSWIHRDGTNLVLTKIKIP